MTDIRDLHIITNDDFVVCQICKKQLTKIDGRHTKKTHSISFDEYKNKFPNTPTITQNKLSRELKMIDKRKQAKKIKEKNLNIVKCIFFDDCKNTLPVSINTSSIYHVCQVCKALGKKHPRTKEIEIKLKEGVIKKYGTYNVSLVKEIVQQRVKTVQQHKEENPEYYNNIVKKRVVTNEETFGDNWKEQFHELQKEGMIKKQ